MSQFRDESETHLIRRLESFSDIVIGFSLAQLTYNLVVPTDPQDLFAKHSITLFAFGITFMVVASLWWSHHRLFTNYFVPTPLNIALNFVLLGGITFLTFALQVWLHAREHQTLAYAMYSFSFGVVLGIIAYLMHHSVTVRGHLMDPGIVAKGRARTFRLTVVSLAAIGYAALTIAQPTSALSKWYLVVFVGIFVVVRLAQNRRSA